MDLDQWLLVSFSGVVAASTVFYVVLTWRLVNETRRIRMASLEPMISIITEVDVRLPVAVALRIRNDGSGPAKNVTFVVPTHVKSIINGAALSDLNPFKDGMKYLAPGGERKLHMLYKDSEGKWVTPFSIKVNYSGIAGGEKTDLLHIDVSDLEGFILGEDPLMKMSEDVNRIRKAAERLVENRPLPRRNS